MIAGACSPQCGQALLGSDWGEAGDSWGLKEE